jgi:hypothetical protein
MIQQQQALGNQKTYYDALIQNMNAQSLNNYAPKYTAATASPTSFYNPVQSSAAPPVSSSFSGDGRAVPSGFNFTAGGSLVLPTTGAVRGGITPFTGLTPSAILPPPTYY